MGRYDEQAVLITGAARGLGRAMAERFAADGAAVALADADSEGAKASAEAIQSRFGRRALWDKVDVTIAPAVGEWVDRTRERLSRVDVLINNAGIIRDNRIENISDDDWHAVVDASLTGAFHGIRAVLPHMARQRYGRILSLSSMSWRGNYGQANYVAAKAGIVGLTRAAALEGARHGITCNAIAPGLIDTPMLASMHDRARDKLVAKIPAGHTGDPVDIAAAAAYLCSKEAAYVTGVVLDVDGGLGIGSSIR